MVDAIAAWEKVFDVISDDERGNVRITDFFPEKLCVAPHGDVMKDCPQTTRVATLARNASCNEIWSLWQKLECREWLRTPHGGERLQRKEYSWEILVPDTLRNTVQCFQELPSSRYLCSRRNPRLSTKRHREFRRNQVASGSRLHSAEQTHQYDRRDVGDNSELGRADQCPQRRARKKNHNFGSWSLEAR